MGTYIFELPSPIKKLALLRQKEAGFIENENMPLQTFNFEGVFNWYNTPEGYEFWSNIDIKDYQCFKDKYGLMGEKLFKPENNTEPAQDFNKVNKNEWILNSQRVITDRELDEPINAFAHRHEIKRRITAEADLIKALDLLNDISKTEERSKFLREFLQ